MRRILKRFQPKDIDDIATVIALYRPGALKFINELISNKKEPNKINYLNKDFKEILQSTYGIIIYQEQLMEIICLVAKYTYAQADIFRRIISKKKPDELIKLKADFINKTKLNGYDNDQAEQFFSYIQNFAGYGFNHSHAVAYAYISY
jgi:DNA polymerase-3 subunit alpha